MAKNASEFFVCMEIVSKWILLYDPLDLGKLFCSYGFHCLSVIYQRPSTTPTIILLTSAHNKHTLIYNSLVYISSIHFTCINQLSCMHAFTVCTYSSQ